MKIKKGDQVKILAGKDRGKTGAVIKSLKDGRFIVEGINMLTKHQRPRREGEKGTKIKFAAPIQAAKVMLICPKCGKSARVGFIHKDNVKFRQCKKCEGTF